MHAFSAAARRRRIGQDQAGQLVYARPIFYPFLLLQRHHPVGLQKTIRGRREVQRVGVRPASYGWGLVIKSPQGLQARWTYLITNPRYFQSLVSLPLRPLLITSKADFPSSSDSTVL